MGSSAGGYGVAGFGAGLAEGIANAFGRKRQTDLEDERSLADRRARTMSSLLPHLLENASDYSEIQPFIDQYILGNKPGGKAAKPKPGEVDPHAILEQAFAPVFSSRGDAATHAAGAGGNLAPADPTATPAGATADQVASVGAPATVDTASGATATAPARQQIGGVHLLNPDEITQRKITEAAAIADADVQRRTQKAREFYTTFKAIDKDFELRDALRMAGFNVDINRSTGANGGKGSDLSQALTRGALALGYDSAADLSPDEANNIASEFYASKRSMGINREALSRAEFGVGFAQLNPQQQQAIIAKETSLLGSHSYAQTAGSAQATFNAPTTIATSAATEVPVGTTGPQLAGQPIPTAADRDARRGTENMQTQLATIKTLLGVLPKKDDLGGYAPGAAIALAKRLPEHREEFAKLEAAVDSLVGAAARNLQQQRGAQTEADATRAYNAIVNLKTSLWDPANGDTQESALARIGETEQLVEQVLSKLPAAPVATAPAGKGAKAAPTTDDAGRRARARQVLASAKKDPTDANIDLFLKRNPTFK